MDPFRKLRSLVQAVHRVDRRLDDMQLALGRIENRQLRPGTQREFKVFSQWGEDGIIQDLVARVPIERKVFVEFGVETYVESNTRFLLQNNGWSGLVLDGSADNVAAIHADPDFWKHHLRAVQAFVTAENIDELLRKQGLAGDIGLLSIDVDGNDYWIWNAISVISPRIVICEYNSTFGGTRAVTVPYDPRFERTAAHASNLYFGASLAALERLGRAKGYSLVASNEAGGNAFFVRDDVRGDVPAVTARGAWVASKFRESRDSSGKLTFLDFAARRKEIAHMAVIDVASGEGTTVGALPDEAAGA